MDKPKVQAGFKPPRTRALGREWRTVALAELAASTALTIATLIAATVVSVGIARADVANNIIDHESSLFGIALLLGLAFIAVGGFAAFPHLPRKTPRG